MAALQKDLGNAQSKRIFAYGFFVFLIALILDLIGESFINGFSRNFGPLEIIITEDKKCIKRRRDNISIFLLMKLLRSPFRQVQTLR